MKKQFKTGAKAGAYSAVLSIIVVAALIVVNLIVGALPSKYTKLDTSKDSMFTFDEKTEKFVSQLGENVSVYHIAEEGSEDTYISEILNRYSQMNAHIKVERVDPAKNPKFVSKYTDSTLSNNSLIVVSEKTERSKVVLYDDIYYLYCEMLGGKTDSQTLNYYNQMYYQQYGKTLDFSSVFAGESAVVSAIDYVTCEVIPKLYVLSGHSESSLNSALTEWLGTQNYELCELEITKSKVNLDGTQTTEIVDVPSDAEALLINSPRKDLSSGEIDSIKKYVSEGGKVIVLCDYISVENESLHKLAEHYGLDVNIGLVLEGDSSKYSATPYYIRPTLSTHSITSGLSNVIMPISHGIKIAQSMPEGMKATALLTTSDKAYAKPIDFDASAEGATFEKADGDIEGPFTVGALVECEGAGKVVWYASSAYMLSDSSAGSSTSTLYASTVNYLCDKIETISVRTIDLTTAPLSVTESSAKLWGTITIAIIPLSFIGIGLYVWLRRRSK